MNCADQHPGYDCGGTCAMAKYGNRDYIAMEENVVKVSRLAAKLYDDVMAAPDRTAALEVIVEAFEQAGDIAIKSHSLGYLITTHAQEERV